MSSPCAATASVLSRHCTRRTTSSWSRIPLRPAARCRGMATSETQAVHAPMSAPPPLRTLTRPVRELPEMKGPSPIFWLAIGAGVLGWAAFVVRATNAERATSSVMRQLVYELRRSDEVLAALGDGVAPEPGWLVYGGHPRVDGSMSVLQGKVDISFRVRASNGSGTVYFTSIRKNKGQKFHIMRFRVVCDDGTILSLREKYEEGLQFEQPAAQ